MPHAHHHHEPTSYNRAFAIGIALNVGFVLIEAGYGLYADSLALIADAGHNLSDVLGLGLAWGAMLLATKASTDRRTYGYRKVTIMASLVSAIVLLVALGGIAWEALGRFFQPQPVAGTVVIVVAAIGVVINTVTAMLFYSGQKHDLNIRSAFLHMAADAAVSFAVIIAGVIIVWQDWLWIDPAITLVIVAVILVSAWGLLRESLNFAIDAVPASIDLVAIRDYLSGLEDVTDLHDLHVWALSTTEVALTVHLVVTGDRLHDDALLDIQQHLHDRFGIAHATIQVETLGEERVCLLDRKKCI
ncbi:MAG: cation diffusion facilitator family transporter [Granulosicoccaceae bacterium]|jgi:cobalt-zinc-cadmium efflux system protein